MTENTAIIKMIDEIKACRNITLEQLHMLLETDDMQAVDYLRKSASEKAHETYGNQVFIRGLIEFTNYCKNDCLYWDKTTRFCGRCGAPMAMHTDISKRCTRCGSEVWPALQAAIIVAVTRRGGEEILLVQSKNFRGDYYGLVAGFVETGETLEECVAREVMEETGLRIRDLRYVASQPWPFPCGLMIGFEAETDDEDIVLQRSELNKGGWFTRQNLPAIPGKVSLARKLIDRWLEK